MSYIAVGVKGMPYITLNLPYYSYASRVHYSTPCISYATHYSIIYSSYIPHYSIIYIFFMKETVWALEGVHDCSAWLRQPKLPRPASTHTLTLLHQKYAGGQRPRAGERGGRRCTRMKTWRKEKDVYVDEEVKEGGVGGWRSEGGLITRQLKRMC